MLGNIKDVKQDQVKPWDSHSELSFVAFEEKSLEDQAEEVTKSLISNETESILTYDIEDRTIAHNYKRSLTSSIIFTSFITYADWRVLSTIKLSKKWNVL